MPNSLLEIGENAFRNIPKIEVLSIGSNLTNIGKGVFCDSKIDRIESHAITPPKIGGTSCFNDNTYLDCKLYVPFGATDDYMNTEGWNLFWNFEEMEKETSLANILHDNHLVIKSYAQQIVISGYTDGNLINIYDVSGKLIKQTYEQAITLEIGGVYIVRIGTYAKKIIL